VRFSSGASLADGLQPDGLQPGTRGEASFVQVLFVLLCFMRLHVAALRRRKGTPAKDYLSSAHDGQDPFVAHPWRGCDGARVLLRARSTEDEDLSVLKLGKVLGRGGSGLVFQVRAPSTSHGRRRPALGPHDSRPRAAQPGRCRTLPAAPRAARRIHGCPVRHGGGTHERSCVRRSRPQGYLHVALEVAIKLFENPDDTDPDALGADEPSGQPSTARSASPSTSKDNTREGEGARSRDEGEGEGATRTASDSKDAGSGAGANGAAGDAAGGGSQPQRTVRDSIKDAAQIMKRQRDLVGLGQKGAGRGSRRGARQEGPGLQPQSPIDDRRGVVPYAWCVLCFVLFCFVLFCMHGVVPWTRCTCHSNSSRPVCALPLRRPQVRNALELGVTSSLSHPNIVQVGLRHADS
jgi:hypothetical protein